MTGDSNAIHGDPLGRKRADTQRIAFESLNGCAAWKRQNPKPLLIRRFMQKYQIDGYFGSETNSNFSKIGSPREFLEGCAPYATAFTLVAYNTNENDTRHQRGGTCGIWAGDFAAQIKLSGVDPTNLGRWCWLLLGGKTAKTRVFVGYMPVNNKKDDRSTYNQQRRFFRAQGERECPRALFRRDILREIEGALTRKENVVFLLDGNENMNDGKLAKALFKMGLRDAVRERTGLPGPGTHYLGSEQIDAAFISPGIECVRARFLPFWSGAGDHRPVVLDISESSLIGGKLLRIQRPRGRRLRCTSTAGTRKYTRSVERQWALHNMETKTERLLSMASFPPPPEFSAFQEQVDDQRVQIMLAAENALPNFSGSVDCSPEVSIWLTRRRAWKAILRWHSNPSGVSRKRIARLAKAAGIERPLSHSKEEAQYSHDTCFQCWSQVKPRAPALREAFLREKKFQAKLKGDREKARDIGIMLSRESARKIWSPTNRTLDPERSGSVTSVQVQKGDEWIELTQKDAVEKTIASTLTARFTKTDDAYLRQDEAVSSLGMLGETEFAKNIINGTARIPTSAPREVQAFLREILEVAKLFRDNHLSIDLHGEVFTTFWNGQKEFTSSSFSTLHYGHWKTLARCDWLAHQMALLTMAAFKSGSWFRRWSIGLTVMLEKVRHCIQVTKLRAILLMEADFNFGNKIIFASRMMSNMEARKVVPWETMGSRKDLTAMDDSISRTLVFDLSRQRRLSMAIGAVDAASCYDAVVHNGASLSFQAMGVPTCAAVCMLGALACMTFHIRTGFGDSSLTYGGGENQPFQGYAQGNKAAPAGWLCLSVFLIRLQKKAGFDNTIVCAISLASFSFCALMYVDDTDVVTMARSENEPVRILVKRHQQAMTHWGRSLRATGGSLKPTKCFVYLVTYSWKGGQWAYDYETAGTTSFFIEDSKGKTSLIDCFAADVEKEIMGILQAPDGSMGIYIAALQDKAQAWIRQLQGGHLHRRLTWKAYTFKMWPSLRYSLPASSMSQEQARSIQDPFYFQLLPFLGINRNVATVLRTTPRAFAGFGLKDIHLAKFASKGEYLLLNGDTDTLAGNNLRASAEQLQMEVGVGTPFFSLPYKVWAPITTYCWLEDLWKDSWHYSTRIEWNALPTLELQREGDQFIMNSFIQAYKDQDHILASLNRVRIFCKVYCLSDVATGDGRRVRSAAVFSPEILNREGSTMVWPTEHPSQSDYRRWTAAWKEVTLEGLALPRPLGQWNKTPHRGVTSWFSPSVNCYFLKAGRLWQKYSAAPGRRLRHSCWTRDGSIAKLPSDAEISGHESHKGHPGYSAYFSGHAPLILESGKATLHETLFQEKFSHLWSDLQGLDQGDWIGTALSMGTAVLTCDGSFQSRISTELGTASWYLYCTKSKKVARASCRASMDSQANPYRAELMGIYTGLCFVQLICSFFTLTTGTLQISCDCDGALAVSVPKSTKVSARFKQVDLVRAIRKVRSLLPISLTFKQVQGHMDDKLSSAELTLEEKLNVLCDTRAKRRLHLEASNQNKGFSTVPHEGIVVWAGSRKLTQNFYETIALAYYQPIIKSRFITKGILSPRGFEATDWEALETCSRSFPDLLNMWVAKHTWNLSATYARLVTIGQRDCAVCPCCQTPGSRETARHQLLCPDKDRRFLFEECCAKLDIWFKESRCHPGLAQALLAFISNRGKRRFGEGLQLGETCAQLEKDQDAIGWEATLMGKISKEIAQLQWEHFRNIGSNRSGDLWAAKLVERLILITHAQWIHRCNVVHNMTTRGYQAEETKELHSRIRHQLARSSEGLEEEDLSLLNYNYSQLRHQSDPAKRVWLRKIMLARGIHPPRNLTEPRTWSQIQDDRRVLERELDNSAQCAVDNIMTERARLGDPPYHQASGRKRKLSNASPI